MKKSSRKRKASEYDNSDYKEDSKFSDNIGSFVEHCEIYLKHGFTVLALAADSSRERLCALRKSDFSWEGDSSPLFLIEFFNASQTPVVFFERSFAFKQSSISSFAWIGNDYVVVGCGDGTLLLLSPHSTKIKCFQLCVTPILAIACLDVNRILIATESSELILVELNISDEPEELDSAKLNVNKRLKFSNEDRFITLASSISEKMEPVAAVGLVNGLSIIRPYSGKNERINIKLASGKQPTVAWSLLFLKNFLFCGDSRGKISIYNHINGAIIKTISSHQAPVLALSTNGKIVFASGVDYRIQIIKELANEDNRTNSTSWVLSGQRIVNRNDVRALCCIGDGNSLVSAGAEHDLIVSNEVKNCCPVLERRSFFANSEWISLKYPYSLELWRREDSVNKILADTDNSIEYGRVLLKHFREHNPKKVAEISNKEQKFIMHASVSRCGQYIFLVDLDSVIRVVSIQKLKMEYEGAIEKSVKFDDYLTLEEYSDEKITSCELSDDGMYFASASLILRHLNFKSKLVRKIYAKKGCGCVRLLRINSQCSSLIVTTTLSQMYVVRLQVYVKENECNGDSMCEELPIQNPIMDCSFIDNKDRLLCLSSDHKASVFIYDMKKKETLFVLSPVFYLMHNEFLSCISQVVEQRIIVTSNFGRFWIVTNLESDFPCVCSHKDKHGQQNASNKIFSGTDVEATDVEMDESQFRKRFTASDTLCSEPFWGSKINANDENLIEHGVVLIKHSEYSSPSQTPINIHKYKMK